MVSGSGTILEAIIKAQIPIHLVIADRPCRRLEVAAQNKIETLLIDREPFVCQKQFNLVAMAGFMSILSQLFFDVYTGLIINTHATRDAISYRVKVSGCTIHLVTPTVDCGKILAQETVKVLPTDTETSLQEKIKTKERLMYPQVLRDLLYAL